MSEEEKSSRTEQPTEKRLHEAHSKGQFPQTPEITATFIMVASLAFFCFGTSFVAEELRFLSMSVLGHLSEFTLDTDSVVHGFIDMGFLLLKVVFPLLLVCVIAAILGGGFQTGFELTLEVLDFNLDKLNPVNGFKRIFGLNSLVQFGIDLLKFIAIGLTLYFFVKDVIKDPIFNFPVTPIYICEFFHKTGIGVLLRLIIVLAVIAAINYFYQKWRTTQDLMMTKDEVKEERKAQEVGPHVKAAQKQMMRRILQRQMLAKVATADVIVTNPTHYAVALKYEQNEDEAPILLAKGENLFAKRIIEIANQNSVPRVENKPVARLLFRMGEVGKPIPSELYQVVAEILAYVYQTHKYYFYRLKQRRYSLNNKK